LWSFYFLIRNKKEHFGYTTVDLDKSAIQILILGVLVYIIFNFLPTLFISEEEPNSSVDKLIYNIQNEWIFGSLSWRYWMYPFSYIGLTLLFLIKPIQKIKIFRIIYGLWILIGLPILLIFYTFSMFFIESYGWELLKTKLFNCILIFLLFMPSVLLWTFIKSKMPLRLSNDGQSDI